MLRICLQKNQFANLCTDILVLIFQNLNKNDLHFCRKVCQNWNQSILMEGLFPFCADVHDASSLNLYYFKAKSVYFQTKKLNESQCDAIVKLLKRSKTSILHISVAILFP